MSLQDICRRRFFIGHRQDSRGQCLFSLKSRYIIIAGIRRTFLQRIKIRCIEHPCVIPTGQDHTACLEGRSQITITFDGIGIGIGVNIADFQFFSCKILIFLQQGMHLAVIGILLKIILGRQNRNIYGIFQLLQHGFGILSNFIQPGCCQIQCQVIPVGEAGGNQIEQDNSCQYHGKTGSRDPASAQIDTFALLLRCQRFFIFLSHHQHTSLHSSAFQHTSCQIQEQTGEREKINQIAQRKLSGHKGIISGKNRKPVEDTAQ